MATSFSSRWSRHGEWTSSSGTAKISRRARIDGQPNHRVAGAPGRAADDVVALSIAFSSGSRCATGPGLECGGHQHQRQGAHLRDPAAIHGQDRDPRPARCGARPAAPARDPVGERRDDRFRGLGGNRGQQDDPDARAGKRIALEVAGKGSSISSLVVIPAPAGARGRETIDSTGLGLPGQPAFDLVAIGVAQPPRDRAGPSRADRLPFDLDDREDLVRGPDQDHLIGGRQRRAESRACRRTGSRAAAPGGARAAASSREGFRGPPAFPRGGLAEPRAATSESPRSRNPRNRSRRPRGSRRASRLAREHVGQQVGRLDVASLPAQVGLADHRDSGFAQPAAGPSS